MAFANCAGIIVFDQNKTILVSTEKGHYSFPKGKRNKGETSLETAWRELEEETGLNRTHVELVSDEYIDEPSRKGNNISVRYYVGRLVRANPSGFTYDKTELQNVEWMTVTEVLKLDKLLDARKEVLKVAYARIGGHL